MTKQDFQKRYHSYRTQLEQEAREEADKVNAEGIDGDTAVAVNFGHLGWCVMLYSAAQFAADEGIIQVGAEGAAIREAERQGGQ